MVEFRRYDGLAAPRLQWLKGHVATKTIRSDDEDNFDDDDDEAGVYGDDDNDK